MLFHLFLFFFRSDVRSATFAGSDLFLTGRSDLALLGLCATVRAIIKLMMMMVVLITIDCYALSIFFSFFFFFFYSFSPSRLEECDPLSLGPQVNYQNGLIKRPIRRKEGERERKGVLMASSFCFFFFGRILGSWKTVLQLSGCCGCSPL